MWPEDSTGRSRVVATSCIDWASCCCCTPAKVAKDTDQSWAFAIAVVAIGEPAVMAVRLDPAVAVVVVAETVPVEPSAVAVVEAEVPIYSARDCNFGNNRKKLDPHRAQRFVEYCLIEEDMRSADSVMPIGPDLDLADSHSSSDNPHHKGVPFEVAQEGQRSAGRECLGRACLG